LSFKFRKNSGKCTISSSDEIDFSGLSEKSLREIIKEVENEKKYFLEKIKFLMKRLNNLNACLNKREKMKESIEINSKNNDKGEEFGKSKLAKSQSLNEIKKSSVALANLIAKNSKKNDILKFDDLMTKKTTEVIAKGVQATGLIIEGNEIVYRQKMIKKWKKVEDEFVLKTDKTQYSTFSDIPDESRKRKLRQQTSKKRKIKNYPKSSSFKITQNQSYEQFSNTSHNLDLPKRARSSQRRRYRNGKTRQNRSKIYKKNFSMTSSVEPEYLKNLPYNMLNSAEQNSSKKGRPKIRKGYHDIYYAKESKLLHSFRPKLRGSLANQKVKNSTKQFSLKKNSKISKFGIRPVKNHSLIRSDRQGQTFNN